jgi:hypothetical protein
MLNYKNMGKQVLIHINIYKRIALASALVTSMLLAQYGVARAAGAASLSFSPASTEASAGNNLALRVHLNTGGEAVNVVQANISYPLSLFDPTKSHVSCVSPFSTAAQQIVNASQDGSKGLIKLACAVAIGGNVGATPFTGEADIATISLHVKGDAPSIHDSSMLKFLTGNNGGTSTGSSGVARASDSSNILGNTLAANVTIDSANQTYSKADLNNDKEINVEDLSIVISNYGFPASRASNPKADINGDHKVDLVDFSILLSNQQ